MSPAQGNGGGRRDEGYEQLRHAVLHARAEAFPLGLGLLRRGGVTAWRRATARVGGQPSTTACADRVPAPGPAAEVPAAVSAELSAELVDVLAGFVLPGPFPAPSRPGPTPAPPPMSGSRSSRWPSLVSPALASARVRGGP